MRTRVEKAGGKQLIQSPNWREENPLGTWGGGGWVGKAK